MVLDLATAFEPVIARRPWLAYDERVQVPLKTGFVAVTEG